MGAIVTYTASVYQDRETGKIECTVIRDVRAGVSGPCESFEVVSTHVDDLAEELFQRGYEVSGSWSMRTGYQGLGLDTHVSPR